jgi:hypothetical protein
MLTTPENTDFEVIDSIPGEYTPPTADSTSCANAELAIEILSPNNETPVADKLEPRIVDPKADKVLPR